MSISETAIFENKHVAHLKLRAFAHDHGSPKRINAAGPSLMWDSCQPRGLFHSALESCLAQWSAAPSLSYLRSVAALPSHGRTILRSTTAPPAARSQWMAR